jgi:membrane protein DedA with SNARE-associated domain
MAIQTVCALAVIVWHRRHKHPDSFWVVVVAPIIAILGQVFALYLLFKNIDVLAGTIGYVLGSLAGWAIGRFGGRPLLDRRGRWLHLSPERLDRAERWFDRWDDLAVLLGRVTPVVRSFVSIPAGLFGMPVGRYTLLTIPGSAAWSFALAGVGYAAGSGYRRFHEDFRYVDYVVVAGIILLAVVLFARWRRSSTLRSRVQDPLG